MEIPLLRYSWIGVLTLATALVACSAPPAMPSASPSSSAPDASALRSDLRARFADLLPGAAYPGSVWSRDEPKRLPPQAFGPFPPDHQPGAFLTMDAIRLDTTLPTAPTEIDVALVGAYDDSWRAHVAQVVAGPENWDIVPLYSSLSSRSSVGPAPPDLDAARTVLSRNGLLAPDMDPHPHPAPGHFEFIRHLDGIPIWTNLGVALVTLKDGGTQAVGRRRPILALSSYPLRSPSDAWSLLAAGSGQTMYVDDGAPAGPTHLAEFVVTSIELVYLELQVLGPRELMQPYYAFRERAGNVLYVPALRP